MSRTEKDASVEEATRRAAEFVRAGQARFVVADLAASGLPDRCADAVVCVDAVFFAEDRVAALREWGGCSALAAATRSPPPRADIRSQPPYVSDSAPLLEAAGLELEGREKRPRSAEQLERMYALWLDHLDEIRDDIGDAGAARLETEARTVGPTSRESAKPLHRREASAITSSSRSVLPERSAQGEWLFCSDSKTVTAHPSSRRR